jgi:HlyD family type I secretion membrane fusion protein
MPETVASPLRALTQAAPDVAAADNPWPLIRAGMIGVTLLVLSVGFWVWLAPLYSAAVGPGFVKVDMNRKTVQHQEGGIVREILVRDGSRVEAGQTLVVLGDVRVDASNEAVRTQLDAELAKVARLSAEQADLPAPVVPKELLDRRSEPRVAELLQRERNLFSVRRDALASQLALLRNQVAETREEVKARHGQLKADDEALKHHRDELNANRALAKDGFISSVRLTTLQRAAAEYESRRAENQAELARAQQKISDLELRAQSLRSQFRQEASVELRQTTTAVFELRERLRPTQDAETRQRIKAPVAGEVVDLKVNSVGTAIGPREPILDIVPTSPDLLVEARIRPEDIAYVRAEATADVRLTAFRYRLTPTVEGKVVYVSADRLIDRATGAPYYTVHVRVPDKALREAGDLKLQAGMPAEVYVQTSRRSALEYLLDPVLGFMQRSMREQ